MDAIKSAMQLIGFNILNSNIKIIAPESEDEQISSLDWSIDIDFNIKRHRDNVYAIYCEIEINKEQQKGYCISIVASAAFQLPKEMPEQEQVSMMYFSGVSMSIANIRAYITNMTSYSHIIAPYVLPAIDMTKLLEAKTKDLGNDGVAND